MKGTDFVGVRLVLTDKAFRIDERSGERTPALCPPGLNPHELEPGLVFSLDAADFELAIHPEDWVKSGAVAFARRERRPPKDTEEVRDGSETR